MLSRPSLSATTAKAISSTIAARTRISAVVSWSRISTPPRLMLRAVVATATPTTATIPANRTNSNSCDPVPLPSAENSSDSRSTAAKSAREEAAIVVCAQRCVQAAGVLEDGDHQAEGGGRDRHREQQRVLDPAGSGQREAGAPPDQQGQREAGRRQGQQATTQRADIDLEPGKEQQHRQAEQRDDLDREVRLEPPEC